MNRIEFDKHSILQKTENNPFSSGSNNHLKLKFSICCLDFPVKKINTDFFEFMRKERILTKP